MARENYPKKGMREVAFKGRLRTADPPTTIAPEDFSVLKNLRYNYGTLKSVGGQTKINTTATTSTALKQGIHFRKDFPNAESHTLVATTGKMYDKTTDITTQGNFSDLFTPTGSGNPRFSLGPNSSVVMANGTDSTIWYGNEHPATGYLDWDAIGNTYKYDYFDQVSNNKTTDVATVHRYSDTVDANTMLLLHCDGTNGEQTFTDSSPSVHTVTPDGHTNTKTAQYKFGTASAYFDGAGDALIAGDSSDWDFTSGGEFTIDFWVLWSASYLPQGTYYYQGTAANHIKVSILTDTITLSIYSGSSEVVNVTGYVGVKLASGNIWAHLAVTCDKVGSDYNYRFFLWGQQIGYGTDTDGPAYAAGNMYVGYDGSSYIAAAYIDEFRVSDTARWTSNFSPPSSSYGTGTNISDLYIASPIPLSGIRFYVGTANATASTASVYYWNGTSWTTVSSLSDGTSASSKSLAQTGTMSFTSTASTAKLKNIEDVISYWYKVSITNCDTTTTIYQVSCVAPMQQIVDLWDGIYRPADAFILYIANTLTYRNWTANVYSSEYDSANTGTVAQFGGMTANDYLYVASIEQLQGFRISFVDEKSNITPATMTVEYWSGDTTSGANTDGWITLPVSDGTLSNNISFGKSGTVFWKPPEKTEEFRTSISSSSAAFAVESGTQGTLNKSVLDPTYGNNNGNDMYFYRISFNATLAGPNGTASADIQAYNVQTIPAPVDCRGYSFPVLHDNSLWLCGNIDSEPNAVIYSAQNRPQVFNGEETGKLFLGDNTAVVAGASFSNQFGSTDTKILLICKESSTWRITGEAPYTVHPVSMTDGCIAPYSIAVGEVEIAQGVRRKVAVWVAQRGVVISDGTSIKEISTDIRDKFSPLHSNYIGASTLPTLHGSIDPVYNEYVLVVPGSAEWRYSFEENKWFQVDRGSAAYLNGAFTVYDGNGVSYMYGFTPAGFVMRLDNGTTFASSTSSNSIASTVRLADIALYNSSMMFQSRINWSSLVFKTKSTTTSTVATTYFVDGNTTGTSIDTADPTASGYNYVNREQHGQAKTGTFHSPQFSITTSDETIGFEPVMWGCEYTVIPREK